MLMNMLSDKNLTLKEMTKSIRKYKYVGKYIRWNFPLICSDVSILLNKNYNI